MNHLGRRYTREELQQILDAVQTLRNDIDNYIVAAKCAGYSFNFLGWTAIFGIVHSLRDCLTWFAPICRTYYDGIGEERLLNHWRDVPREWMGPTALLDGAVFITYRSIYGEKSVSITPKGELIFGEASGAALDVEAVSFFVDGCLSLRKPVSKLPFTLPNVDALVAACDNVLRLSIQSLPDDWPSDSEAPKHKRSTERGEARSKLIGSLNEYHKYADEGCLNLAPIGNNELARRAKVSESTASAFFATEFGGHAKYRYFCGNARLLATALKMLNQEFSPCLLLGAVPSGEGERDDEE